MIYTESQKLKYSGKWYVISAILFISMTAILLILFKNIDEMKAVGIIILSLLPLLLVGLFMYISSFELNIKIDEHGIHYRMSPLLNNWAHISKRELISHHLVSANQFESIKSSKKQTVWTGQNKRYMVLGSHLLVLNLTKERKLGLSTLKPSEINKALKSLLNLS